MMAKMRSEMNCDCKSIKKSYFLKNKVEMKLKKCRYKIPSRNSFFSVGKSRDIIFILWLIIITLIKGYFINISFNKKNLM